MLLEAAVWLAMLTSHSAQRLRECVYLKVQSGRGGI
ncbi:hypothetical protein VCF_001891 [Vibrio cholerae BX 330286]|nr:hypothetical protein VCF_001891 [Vibrio cholerae BX 330286]